MRPIVIALVVYFFSLTNSVAGPGECDSVNMSTSISITEGASYKGVTQRCIRRMGEGVRVTCDSGEMAQTVSCELNLSATPISLVSSGIKGTRSAICLWSGNADVTIVVGCKAVSQLKRDYSGDLFVKGASPPDHLYESPAATTNVAVHKKKKRCRCRSRR